MKPTIAMVVLAYEDGPSLPSLVDALERVLTVAARDHAIIVVDDGSRDGTPGILAELASTRPRLTWLRHDRNLGVGATFADGVAAADAEVVGYIDGDGQYDPEDLPGLVEALQDADMAFGWRPRRGDGWRRALVSGVYNALVRAVFDVAVRDVNCGLKLFRRAALASCLPLGSSGPFYDAELAIRARAAGCRISEVPVRHLPRRHGRARGIRPASVLLAVRGFTSREMAPYAGTARGRVLRNALRLLLPTPRHGPPM